MIYVFLPAYNEEIALPKVVQKFSSQLKERGESFEFIVLDDGSRDRTSAVAEELKKNYPVTLLRHEINQGLGVTMRDGFEYLAKNTADEDLVVTLDCDDTHEPQFLSKAIQKVRAGYDLVILSRYCGDGGQLGLSWVKTVLSLGAGVFLKIFFPIDGVREYSCGYRVFRAALIKKAVRTFGAKFIQLAHLGFAATPETLIRMRMLGAKIGESPFVLRYDQKPTKSTNKAFKTIHGYFAIVWTYWGRKV